MVRSAQLPVVSIMKYPDSHLGVNPTVQIGMRSKKYYPTTDPRNLLRQIVATMKSSRMVDFAVLEGVRSTQIDGLPAATVTVRFSFQMKSGENLPTVSRLYYAINSENVIIVGMSGPDSGVSESEEEFRSILHSLRFAR